MICGLNITLITPRQFEANTSVAFSERVPMSRSLSLTSQEFFETLRQ